MHKAHTAVTTITIDDKKIKEYKEESPFVIATRWPKPSRNIRATVALP